VLEQFPDGDPAAVVAVARHHARQPVRNGVVQGEPVLGGQLQDHRGDERLGGTADAELVIGPYRRPSGDVGLSGGGIHGSTRADHLGQHTDGSGLLDHVHLPL